MGPVRWTVLDSPIDRLAVAADATGIRAVRFAASAIAGSGSVGSDAPDGGAVRSVAADGGAVGSGAADGGAVLDAAVAELHRYFAGELLEFTVPLAAPRGSDFERAVWTELTRIPYGEMWTYGDVAAAVGDRGAARAVGVACNRNPVPVIVPCHRVVGAGGRLVGFGGGLPRKRHLLELEARVALQRAWS